MNAKNILPGQNLNESLNTHWKKNMQKEHAPRAFKIYNIYFVLWKLSHIYPQTVDTGYFSWNKLFSSYWKLKESQEIPVGFKAGKGTDDTDKTKCMQKTSLLRIGALTPPWQRKYWYLNPFIINTQCHNWRQICFTFWCPGLSISCCFNLISFSVISLILRFT